MKIKKFIINIILGFVPSAATRKDLRNKWLYTHNSNNIKFEDKIKNNLNNNSIVVISPNNKKSYNVVIKGLNINFNGQNSSVIIHEPINMYNCNFRIGKNSCVEICASPYEIHNLSISATNNSKVFIGENFSCRGCKIENHDEANLNVKIGNDCMFSYGIHFRVSDGHSLFDTNNKEIINKPKTGISIGEHVWIGMKSTILKDVKIADNVVIGACSLVNKCVAENFVAVAGAPAKIIKRNVNWDRRNTDKYTS